ncbi:hypothetical protein [Mycobacterium sp. ACS4331]|uniref:hypothetical protein n=1 Tax=Mycobacterium sp. ACS4331 TaxID=1834121 RepID=UPI000A65E9D4|nr:hypothetical protein [Mycobacterium sp. ACS4331]
MAEAQGIIDVPPEQLRDTMTSVLSAMMQSSHLSKDCTNLIEELVGSGAFKGPAAVMAMQTMAEINTDMQKILQHGTALAEHLGTTADQMDNSEVDSVAQLQSVLGSIGR